MRNPGRSDAGDARSDRNDARPSAEAGDVGVPADGDAAFAHDPEPTPDGPHVRPPVTSSAKGRPLLRIVLNDRNHRRRNELRAPVRTSPLTWKDRTSRAAGAPSECT